MAQIITKKTIHKVASPVVETAPVVHPIVKTKFNNKNILISPRKLRLLATEVKKLTPADAMLKLKFTYSLSARVLVKSILSAVNDAIHNHGLIESTLRFYSIRVDEGLKIKRMDKSHGSRFNRGVIIKRHSRLEIILEGQKV